MAEKLYPLASANGNIKYYASDVQRHYANIIGNKVIIGDTLKVSARSTPDLSVNVSAGTSVNLGKEYRNSATLNLPITANTTTYNRIDNIVVDFSLTSNFIKVVKGTATSTPVAPTVTSNQILLAQVLVGAGVTSIQSSNITDGRTIKGQHMIDSMSKLLFEIEEVTNSLKKRVLDNKKINSLASYSYTTDTLEANPGEFYIVSGTTRATVRGMDATHMKEGDKVYFCMATDQGSLILLKGNNLLLPSNMTQLSLTRDVVYECVYFGGYFRLLAI